MTAQEMREEHIQQTIERSKQAYYEGLEAQERTWGQFLLEQLQFVQKRWWAMQLLVLLLLWITMYFGNGELAFQRQGAVLMPLFGLFIVPELWKNVRNHALEVENAACFTMRQIYAARLTVFSMMDLLLLTVFFAVTSWTVHLTLLDIIIHFLIPLNVTACICLGCLCGRRFQSEYVAIVFCILWSSIWYQIICEEQLYHAISGTVWAGLLALTVAGIGLLGKHLLKTSVLACSYSA